MEAFLACAAAGLSLIINHITQTYWPIFDKRYPAMSLRDALLSPPKMAQTLKTRGSVVDRQSSTRSQRSKRSDFLRAYSSISISQVLRVMLLVLIGLGFTKLSYVAHARPGAVVGALAGHGLIGDFRNLR